MKKAAWRISPRRVLNAIEKTGFAIVANCYYGGRTPAGITCACPATTVATAEVEGFKAHMSSCAPLEKSLKLDYGYLIGFMDAIDATRDVDGLFYVEKFSPTSRALYDKGVRDGDRVRKMLDKRGLWAPKR